MNSCQLDVMNFHVALDHPIGPYPGIDHAEWRDNLALRRQLLLEETLELDEACSRNKATDIIKEMCDVLYVVYGMAVTMGVDLTEYWNAVHASNMAKKGGSISETGKRLKPPDWEPPDLDSIFKREVPYIDSV